MVFVYPESENIHVQATPLDMPTMALANPHRKIKPHQMKYHYHGHLSLWKIGLFLHHSDDQHGTHDPQHGMGNE
jgi:hypothetical protein